MKTLNVFKVITSYCSKDDNGRSFARYDVLAHDKKSARDCVECQREQEHIIYVRRVISIDWIASDVAFDSNYNGKEKLNWVK